MYTCAVPRRSPSATAVKQVMMYKGKHERERRAAQGAGRSGIEGMRVRSVDVSGEGGVHVRRSDALEPSSVAQETQPVPQ